MLVEVVEVGSGVEVALPPICASSELPPPLGVIELNEPADGAVVAVAIFALFSAPTFGKEVFVYGELMGSVPGKVGACC